MKRGRTSNLRRSTHLVTLCFVLIIGGIAGVAAISQRFSSNAVSETSSLTGQLLPATVELGKLQRDISKLSALNLKVSMAPDEAAMDAQIEGFQSLLAKAQNRFVALTDAIKDEEFSREAANVTGLSEAYAAAASEFQAAMKEGDFATAMTLLDGEVAKAEAELSSHIDALGNNYVERALASAENTGKAIGHLVDFSFWSSAAMVLTALFFAVVAIVMSRTVANRLGKTSERLADAAKVVDEKASGLAESSAGLAESASEQAATIEETTASVEGIAVSMQRIASDAEHSKKVTADTRNEAETCAASMEDMRLAMGEVKQSSDKIARIIKTIDEIAFQTNLLALNAAVEAARAGVAGAGFAVVAEEVRALAHRSADAAKETASTIEDALRRTDRSVQLTEQVSGGLNSMVEHTREVNEVMANIAAACQEQNESLNQLRDGVAQINEVTQRSAASADAESEASGLLNEQAAILTDSVEELFAAVGQKREQSLRKQAGPTGGGNGRDFHQPTRVDSGFPEHRNRLAQFSLAER